MLERSRWDFLRWGVLAFQGNRSFITRALQPRRTMTATSSVQPGKWRGTEVNMPDNAYIEWSNGKFRSECFERRLLGLDNARATMEAVLSCKARRLPTTPE